MPKHAFNKQAINTKQPNAKQAGQNPMGLPRSATPATRRALVSRFLDAVERGDRPAVSDLLRNFSGLVHAVKVYDANGLRIENSPLHLAAMRGHLGVVQELLQADAPVDAQNFVGETPLMLAAAGGHTDTVKFLLSRKAKADHAASEGYTALIYAARNAAIGAAQCLLQKGADVNKPDDAGRAPLHYAVHAEDRERTRQMLRLLLAKGADAGLVNIDGETASDEALLEKKPEVAGFILGYVQEKAQQQARDDARKKAHISDSFRHGIGQPISAPPRAKFARKNKPSSPAGPAAPAAP